MNTPYLKNLGLLLACILTPGFMASCSYRFYSSGCDKEIPGNLEKIIRLDTALAEPSGLLYLDGQFWSFNDSGGEAALYCLDKSNGQVIRKAVVRKATNADWEDIAMDDRFVYIADVGNNFATRDTIVIYRIPVSELRNGAPEISYDGIITLSFDEYVLTNHHNNSSHDCEAMVVHNDSLYLFSKNWVYQTTSVYVVPGIPGHYHVKASHLYDARMLVTGADLYRDENQMVLIGYRDFMPVVVRYDFDTDPGRIACGGRARIYPLKIGRQVEGICFDRDGSVYISSERRLHKQTLFKLGGSLH